MNISYELYQADRVKTTREQREEDVRAGELAAGFWQLWHSLAHPRGGGRRGFRATAGAGQARAACGSSTGPHAICG